MRDGGRRLDSYYAHGMLEIRTTLHLAFRLTIRVNQILETTGAASEGSGLWRVALPAFVALDVAIWFALRRSDRFGLAWRLPLDAFDAAFWTMSPFPPGGQADLAVLIAVPLAVEAGVRMGWRGLVVPGAILASTTAASVATDKPAQLITVAWIATAATIGMAFFRYCRHLDARAEGERRRFLAAARRRAYLAGQNDVAMGASSAVDIIEGLVPVLGRPPSGSALWRLADGWKSQLSTSTARDAAYLQVALLEWERFHNAHPDLSGLVEVQVEEGHGTALLSVDQVDHLRRALDRLPLRGAITFRLVDAGRAHLPGQELRLAVGDHQLVVPADRRASPASLDPAAVVCYYVAVLVANSLLAPAGGFGILPVAAGVTLCVVTGLLSHRQTMLRGPRARLGVYQATVAVSLVLTALLCRPPIPVRESGTAILGFSASLSLLALLGGFYWRSLGGWRWLMPAGMAANVAIVLATFPVPSAVSGRNVLASVMYHGSLFFPFRHLSQSLDAAAAEHTAAVEAVDAGAERAAFLEGRESVVGLVRRARQDALDQLVALGPGLDGHLADLAAHRLEEVDRRLGTIEG